MAQEGPLEKRLREAKLKGVIFDFVQGRLDEGTSRLEKFVQSPIGYVQENQPVRKAVLLELLELLRPGVDVEWEHKIEKWRGERKIRRG